MRLTEQELSAIIRSHRRDSLGSEDGELSSERAEAMDHYHGRPYGTEVEGRSAVVSRDLAEAVDWALPAILRPFVQTGVLGEFSPVGPEDEQLAQQESDYTNQVMMRDNPGFMVLHDAIKDTLLLKNGYVKHFWEDSEKVEDVEYTGLTMEALVKLMSDLDAYGSKVEIKGQDSSIVNGVEYFDVKLKITKKCGKLVWMAVPTEEVRVSKRCKGSLQDSPFTEHVTRKTRSALIEMGMPRSFVDELPAYNEKEQTEQTYARDSVDDESDDRGAAMSDRSMDEIEYCEAYIRVDWDGDGVAELRKVVTCADRIPPGEEWNEAIPAVPMTGFVMKRVPHRHIGESLDDEIKDIQEVKTVLSRQLLDNIYLINNAQTAVNERVNLKDFMTSTPGGVKRIKGDGPVQDSMMPIPTAPVFEKILPVIDYMDKTKEARTGIRPGSDMDPDILRETTKGAFFEALNRASQKIEMITRMIAESGVKEAFIQCHSILVRHQNQPRMVQMRGKWVQVNPQEWKERTDLIPRVGLGTGNEEDKQRKLILLAQGQEKLHAMGMVGPEQAYALFEDLAKTLGFDAPDKYVMSPSSQEFKDAQAQKANQPPPQVMAEQIKAQAKAQSEQMRATMQQQTDAHRQEMEAQQQAMRMQMEERLRQQELAMEMQMEQMRAALKQETDVLIARIKAEASLDAAQITAQTTLTAQQEAASDNAVGDFG